MEDILHYEIPIYNFPYDIEEDDEETIADNMELRVSWGQRMVFGYAHTLHRQCFPSQLSVLKRKLRLMENQFALEYTLGVWWKLITQITLILLGFAVLFLGSFSVPLRWMVSHLIKGHI